MRKKLKKIIVLIAGIIFILLGLIGLIIPFLQGILFLIIGFLLVLSSFPKFRLWTNEQTKNHPRLSAQIEKIEKWLTKIIGEI